MPTNNSLLPEVAFFHTAGEGNGLLECTMVAFTNFSIIQNYVISKYACAKNFVKSQISLSTISNWK